MKNLISSEILNLSGIEITNVEIRNNEVHIYIKSSDDNLECPLCHSNDVYVHQRYIRHDIRDRAVFDRRCYLHIEEKVIACNSCGKKPREKFDFIDPYQQQTNRFKEYMVGLSSDVNASSISVKEDVGYRAVEKILRDYVEKHKLNGLNGATRIGIDEFSNKKGHRDFCAVIANLNTGKPIEVLENRNEKTIRRYLSSIPEEERLKVSEVSLDMWLSYINLAKEFFPNARITIDRFHVMMHVNKILNKIRVKEYKSLTKEQKESVKNIRWIMLKNSAKLTDEEKVKLKLFFSFAKQSKKVYCRKEEFVNIMNKITDITKGKKALLDWLQKLRKLKTKKAISFAKTVSKLIDYIANYFYRNTTNSTLEGIMNKIKSIKRRCFGVPNPYNMATRIFIAFLPNKSLYSTM